MASSMSNKVQAKQNHAEKAKLPRQQMKSAPSSLLNEGVATSFALESPTDARPEQLLTLQQQAGNQAVDMLIQTKLKVGAAGDQYEEEADRLANQIMAQTSQTEPIQRKAKKKVGSSDVQMKSDANILQSFDANPDIEKRIRGKSRSGSALPGELRTFMEGKMQASFGDVRVHTDQESASINDSLQSKAFTQGKDIFFNSGQFQPGTHEGKKLIAHELTHVVQQNQLGAPVVQRGILDLFKGKKQKIASLNAVTPTNETELKGNILEQAGDALESDYANLAFGAGNLAFGGLSTIADAGDNKDFQTGATSASVGMTSLQTIGSGISFAGHASKFHRARQIGKHNTKASAAVSSRLKRKAGYGMAQQGLNVVGGGFGITSGGLSLAKPDDAQYKTGSNMTGGVSGALGFLSSSIGIGQGSASVHTARTRRSQAIDFQQGHKIDPQQTNRSQAMRQSKVLSIANQVEHNQGRGKKSAGLFGNITGAISNALNAGAGFGGASGSTKTILSGISLGIGALGSAVSGITGIVSSRRASSRTKQGAEAKTTYDLKVKEYDSAKTHLDTLTAERDALQVKLAEKEKLLEEHNEKVEDESASPKLKTKLQLIDIPELKNEIKELKKQFEAKETEIIKAENTLYRIELEKSNAEDMMLSLNPDEAANKVFEGIKDNDDLMIEFATTVLGIKAPLDLLDDEAAAKELIKGKINKLAE